MYIAASLCIWLLRAWKIGQIETAASVLHKPPEDLTPETTVPLEDGHGQERKKVSPFVSRLFRWQKV